MNGHKHAYTIAEITQITGSSRSTIYAEIAAQRLAAKKLGRRTLILAEDLCTWLSSLPGLQAQALATARAGEV